MIQDTLNSNHYVADEGKTFRRLSDGFIFGNELYLGYTYYIGGVKLDNPILEKIEDFEEILDVEEINYQEDTV